MGNSESKTVKSASTWGRGVHGSDERLVIYRRLIKFVNILRVIEPGFSLSLKEI